MVHKNWFFTLMLIAFSVFFVTGETGMVSADPGMNEGIANQALCLPGNDVSTTDCLVAGPISRLKELASIGITFPPLPSWQPRLPTNYPEFHSHMRCYPKRKSLFTLLWKTP